MWEGLLKNLDTLEAARSRCDSLISDLKAYGLLVEDEKETVKINDLIWHTAYSIAQSHLKASMISKEWPPEEWLRSLRFCNMTIESGAQVHEKLQCPDIQEIILSTDNPSIQVPNSFFDETKLLKVLKLIGFDCLKLPSSFGLLKNLQALSMYNCELGDITIVGELTNLQILVLLGSRIQQLPREIGQLQKLLILDLRDTYLQVIPSNVLSNLTSLEELYLRNSFCNWEVERSNSENRNASLKELTNLHRLAYIEDLYVPDPEAWPMDLYFEKMKSYTIFIGDRWTETHNGDHGLKVLKLKLNQHLQLEDGIERMVKNVDVLYLDELNGGVQDVLSDLDEFPHLQSLFVQNNVEIKCIAVSSSDDHHSGAFSNLESLSLNNVSNLKHICQGPLNEKSFLKIKVIKVQQCHNIKCLFIKSMIEGLPHLVDLEVSECKLIDAIVVGGKERIVFPQLRSLRLQRLPALLCFYMHSSYRGLALFDEMISFPNLERMVISNISVSRLWGFPYSDQNSLGRLKNLYIEDFEFPEMTKMHIEDLPSFKGLFNKAKVECLSLENVVVNHCPELHTFGLGMIERSQLKSMIIDNQDQLYNDAQISQLFLLLDEISTISEFTIDGDEQLSKAEELCEHNPFFLAYLTMFKAKNCSKGNRLLLIFRYLEERSLLLEHITIEHCRTEPILFDVESFNVYSLKELVLIELPDLVHIWSNYRIRYNWFDNLIKIHIKRCPSLERVFRELLKSPLKLNELKIQECVKLTEVLPHYFDFKSLALSKVELMTLPELFMFSEYDIPNLTKLTISHCNSMEMIFRIREGISYPTELLQQLTELTLINLPNLTHIVNKEMEENKTSFPQLKYVSLENLTKLTTVFPSTSQFPSLETLIITNCPALITFLDDSNEKDLPEPATSNYFFPNSLSLNKLKVLCIINQDVEKLWHYNSPQESFCELENLTLRNNKLLNVISSNMIKRYDKLRFMTVDKCVFMTEIFHIEDDKQNQNIQEMFPQLRWENLTLSNNNLLRGTSSYMITRYTNLINLTVDKCELLTEVFYLDDDKQDENIKEMLPQLRALTLSNLKSLTYLWNKEPQVPFFPNLVSLNIVNCGSLKSLFSCSATKNLGKLKLLKLCKCEKIEKILSEDKEENVSIIFPEVECLILKDLPKLISFCQQSRTIDWPKLQKVSVSNIPIMKTFSGGQVNTPLLRSVYITFLEKYWLGNLNKTISYIHHNAGM
ncbi:uncharacterized protein LOC113854289 [Abrus precatorius]|uniref:Uncharacterized protein LOC113854289 n=1 Tax=Abrus precatorius TaxID=3816 RepID=A0A8B8KBA5_ABRPR|nr:uncharacterized protein LOC113854289 [Abrus precatorius]